jgi:hypothetical protein
MIFNNNIKKFIEVSKANIDRLIISSHFNSHLSIDGTIQNIKDAYDEKVSADYVSQTIIKHMVIMANVRAHFNSVVTDCFIPF